MCEVLRSNFSDAFPGIEQAIQKCDFVAIDTEFTGLNLNQSSKPSLFDDPGERYKKLRKTISQITMSQIGISVFTRYMDENRYEAKTYNFYLYPRSFGPIDKRFICQASSLEFLCRYEFDFNKFIYDGISHLSEEEEKIMKDHLASKAMFAGLERDVDEKCIQVICSRVAEWIVVSQEGESMTISKGEMERIPVYVLSMELRGRFPEIWTSIQGKNSVVVEKISAEQRQAMEKLEVTSQKEQEGRLIEDMLGFTRIFRVLTQCQKPLIGHNLLMDLLLIYDKFHHSLPATYEAFKTDLHTMLPTIFDTKHLSANLRRTFEETGLLQQTALGNLYADLDSDKGRDLVIHPPTIVHAEGFDRYRSNELPHEAGYDAYMCGYAFLRLAHVIMYKDTKSSDVIPCLFRRYLQSTSKYRNKINVIRGGVNHINLEGPDPASNRPELLFVKSRGFQQNLNVDQLAKWFSPYGSVDVREYGSSRALVATGNYSCAKDILRSFKKHKTISVTKYSMWKHSPVARRLLWSSVIVSGGFCVWVLFSGNKKS